MSYIDKSQLRKELECIMSKNSFKTLDLLKAINTYNLQFKKFKQYLGSIDTAKVVASACEVFGIKDPSLLKERTRNRSSATAKMFMYKYLSEYSGEGPTKIGERFDRTHSNVIHGKNRINDLLGIKDPVIVDKWHEFINLVQQK